jgi:hypothetical protein
MCQLTISDASAKNATTVTRITATTTTAVGSN